MKQDCSAYVSIYNDWDILPDALGAIAPYVSEIVIVDGGYVWMRAYLEAIGLDPVQSDPRVALAAQAYDVPVRIITGLWHNEIEKRLAGYRACTTRYVFRVDADEILVMDETELARFFAAEAAFAQMEMPICVAPGLVRVSGPSSPFERQSLLFDTSQVSAEAHLHLLWLVLGPEALPALPQPQPLPYPNPVAFNFHLTGWRTPQTSIIRASFYTLNYARQHGLAWINHLHGGPLHDLSQIFANYIAPAVYRETLLNADLVINLGEADGAALRPVRHNPPRLRQLHYAFLSRLADLNAALRAAGRAFINGQTIMLDLSSPAARLALLPRGEELVLAVSSPPAAARAKMRYQLAGAPWAAEMALPYRLAGDGIHIRLPDPMLSYQPLRQVLCIDLWCATDGPLHRLLPHA
jgi:hypothetical protein